MTGISAVFPQVLKDGALHLHRRWPRRPRPRGRLLVAGVGRTPTLFKVRTVTVPMGKRLSDGLTAYQRREGITNATEALRHARWAFLMQEELLPPEDTEPAPAARPKRKTPRT